MPEGRRRWCLSSSKRELTLPLPFCSTQALSGLDDTHPHRQGWSLLSLQIQILISSGNIFTDTHRNHVLPAMWASLSPVRLKHKVNHDKGWLIQWFEDAVNDLGSFSLSLHSCLPEYQLNPYTDRMMTAVILGITVRHEASRRKGERIPQQSYPHIAWAISEPHVPISESVTGKRTLWDRLFQPLLRVQEKENNWTKAWFYVERKWKKLQMDRKFIVSSIPSKVLSSPKNP